ncbi:hypothetical protein GC194_08655 [bacterium]|nr:hypothetical protein [bacterium]
MREITDNYFKKYCHVLASPLVTSTKNDVESGEYLIEISNNYFGFGDAIINTELENNRKIPLNKVFANNLNQMERRFFM